MLVFLFFLFLDSIDSGMTNNPTAIIADDT